MEIKEIEKLSKYVLEIKEIDAKIIALENICISVNDNKDLKLSISLNATEFVEKQTKIESDVLSWKSSMYVFEISPLSLGGQKNTMTTEIKEEVDVKHFFMFANYMLNVYQKRREYLLKKLQKSNERG